MADSAIDMMSGAAGVVVETGGVLVGYWLGDEVIITAATQAGPLASHKRDRYDPDPIHDEERVADLYDASGRVWTYLGDWHTHIDGNLVPSRLDRRTLRRIADDRAARASRPLMVIVEPAKFTALAVWLFAGRTWFGGCRVQRLPDVRY